MVLTAIDTYQLPCDSRRIEQIVQGRNDVLRAGATLQNRCGALVGKMLGRLPCTDHCRSGADGIDTDMRGQRLRSSLGKGPQAHLGQSVSHEFRGQLAYPLVD